MVGWGFRIAGGVVVGFLFLVGIFGRGSVLIVVVGTPVSFFGEVGAKVLLAGRHVIFGEGIIVILVSGWGVA